jgi:hypothetical protein
VSKVKQKVWDWNSTLKKVVLKNPTLMCYHLFDVPVKQRAEHAKRLSENFNYAWRKLEKEVSSLVAPGALPVPPCVLSISSVAN